MDFRPPPINSEAGLAADYGEWANYRIPEDRSAWHPTVRCVYEYWCAAAPPDTLPGRQHISPFDLTSLLSHLLLIDVHREPPRFRYRLIGTQVAWSRRRDPTGQWLDEVHGRDFRPYRARYRYVADTGSATWRRGPSIWDGEPRHLTVENCLMPLAKDGKTVDMILGVSVMFNSAGEEIYK